MRYRVEPQFSVNPMTGFPKNDWVVQKKTWRGWTTITSLGVFGNRNDAMDAKNRLDHCDLLKRESRVQAARKKMLNRGRK